MKWLRNLFSPVQEREADVKVNIQAGNVNLGQSSLVRVTGDDALCVTAYKRALDVLSGSVARLPFRYMRMKDGIYTDFEGDPLHYLLTTRPQRRMSAFQWRFNLVWQAMHDGDAYVWPRFIDGQLAELVLIARHRCQYEKYLGTYYITDEVNGVYGTFGEDEVIHVKFNTLDGFTGIPLWKLGARALSISGTGDNETLERFSKGGNVRGIVSNNPAANIGIGQYGREQIESMADDLERKFKQEGRNIAGIEGDAKFLPFSQTSADMQFLDSRKFAVLEISRLSGVPPIYLYDTAGANYKAPEQADVAYLTQSLDRLLTAIETEFQCKLVSRSMCCKRIFRFDRRQIFSMDLNSMAEYQQKTLENGTHSINDWRRFENQPTIDGGDKIYLGPNKIPIDKLGQTNTDNNNPTP